MNISDIKLLEKYMKSGGNSQIVEQNNLNRFASGDRIYPWTNEPLSRYCEINLKNKKVLSVTSSGDHILHAALAGAKEITGFDINRFCKYYSALKVAMIKTYTCDEFLSKVNDFDYFSPSFSKVLFSILQDTSKFLTKDEIKFLSYLVKYLNKNNHVSHQMFYPVSSFAAASNNAYFDVNAYDELHWNLNDCSIKYLDSGIDKLNNILNEEYDLIYLSNILGRVDGNNINPIINVINSISQLLKKDGVIYDYTLPQWDWHFLDEKQNSYMDELKNLSATFEDVPFSKGRIYKYKKQEGASHGN